MKHGKVRLVVILVIVCVLMLVIALPVMAGSDLPGWTGEAAWQRVAETYPAAQTDSPFDWLLPDWYALVGVAALITLLINLGKKFGIVKDGMAPTWSAGLNLIGLALLLMTRQYFPDMDINGLDGEITKFVEVAAVVVAYIVQLTGSKYFHSLLRSVPLVGASHPPVG